MFVSIPLHYLVAVNSITSTKETRHYLRGVYVCASDVPSTVLLVATEGRAMTVRCVTLDSPLPESFKPVIVSIDAIKELAKSVPARAHEKTLVAFDASSLSCAGVVYNAPYVDGTFPDWRRVLPTGPYVDNAIPTAFNHDLLVRVCKAMGVAKNTGISICVGRNYDGTPILDGPMIVRVPSDPLVMSCVMPMRRDVKCTDVPAWIHAPTERSELV